METKETIEDYLIRILRTSENEKYIKEHRYLKQLNLPDNRDGLIKGLFFELYKNGTTPSKYLPRKLAIIMLC